MALSDADRKYPLAGADQVSAHPNFPALEEQILEYWRADGTFRASIEARDAGEKGSGEFVFYDGPPFANGLPHYGHLLTGYVKDVVPRYRTMRGSRVERRFGWDTHGLPAELEAMSQLGLKTKDDILELGIAAFNDACRESVLKYTGEWENYVTRQARWVDFEGDYKTLEPWYMESVLWAFKTLFDKGLVYEGLRVLPYCWNDETPLSNHELRMDDDVYQQRQDPAVTVGLRLESGELALIWTTTPWTLPSNLAVAVGPDIDYVVLRPSADGSAPAERYVVAASRVAAYAREFGNEPEILQTLTGADLVGRTYTPIFSYFADHEGAFRILPADYVTTEDGTGLVHIAPAFGEEDKAVTDAAGIAPVVPVGASGRFEWPVTDYAGMQVFDANAHIIDDLKKATRSPDESVASVNPGTVLLRHETYDHSYPHCWRCRKPLIYKAVSSWFVEVTKFKDRMVELNQDITWVPEHVKDGQFGKWLSNARDWSISRNRFWGSPIPVWKSDDPAYPRIDVYGSIAELEADFGVPVADLHRPFIDTLTRPNPDDPTGKSTMRRIEDVLDVWFDSGSMPFAQVGYPVTNADWFENHFPGDFIVEYIGQTRGWFYTMHVLSTALFDRPAFKTCLSHGIVLGSDGQKMSKSLRNYPDVSEVFDRDGSDAMRWFLMSSPILRGGNLVVTEQGIRESVRQAVLPLWNAWYFHALYAGAAGPGGTSGKVGELRADSQDVLDRYLLAKTADLVGDLTEQLDVYDIAGACASVRSYLELLTNWYIRRSRDRFWTGDDDAIDTLHTVLETVTRLLAPLLPLTTEQIWRGLTGGRSVHLTDYPAVSSLPADPELVSAMDEIREVASVALSLRKEAKIRVRQPLSKLTVTTPAGSRLEFLSALLSDEVNVRSVEFHELSESGPSPVQRQLTVNARAAGPRLGKQVQAALKAAKAGDWTEVDGVVTAGGIELAEGEYTVELVVDASAGGAVAVLKSGGFVALDLELTDELRADGDVADLIRLVQQARKDADLHVSDRIQLGLGVSAELWAAVQDRAELVQAETLALELVRIDQIGDAVGSVGEAGEQLWVSVAKVG